MNIKRAFLALAATLLLPGLAMAGTTGAATFTLDFDFDDGNPMAAMAHYSCNGGLPIKDDQVVTDGNAINFVVTQAENPTAIDCRVWVDEIANYTSDHHCSNCADFDFDENNPDGTGCFFSSVQVGEQNTCYVNMDADDAILTINKEWDFVGNAGNTLDIDFEGRIRVCTDSSGVLVGANQQNGQWCTGCLVTGPGADSCDFTFTGANWEGNAVRIFEQNFDSAIEVDISDCVKIGPVRDGSNGSQGGRADDIFNGDTPECTIYNTVFFEGIPTLNQYGLAIMALLMLGVGFVGFRRFV